MLVTCHLALVTRAFGATHVTGTYDLGANPRIMTTVGGMPEYGLIFAQRNKSVTYNNVEYGPSTVKGYLNSSGQINDGAGNLWLDLIPNAGAVPTDSYYVVTINIQGRVHAEIWIVPDLATVSVETVRQAQPPSPTSSGLDLTNATGLLGLAHGGTGQASWTAARCVRINNLGNALESASGDCGTGGGSAPIASATVSGTVKTDTTAADPVVYLKTSADTLLAGKASSVHPHSESDVTQLTTDLAGKAPTARALNTSSPLAGGGTLAADLTLSCPTCEATGNRNAANGYAGLNASSKIAASQIQEVISSADLSDLSGLFGSAPGTKAVTSALGGDPTTDNCVKWIAGGKLGDAGAACGSGGGSHNLLSAMHSDTSAASAVRGDGIFAIGATPTWQRVAHGTTSGSYFKWNGADIVASTNAAAGPGSCTNQAVTALNADASPTCTTLTSSYVDGTIEKAANKNAASGYAGLDSGSRIAKAQAPSTTVYTDASNTFSTGTQDMSAATATLPVKAGTDAGKPATCTANKELYIKTDVTAGQQLFICNATGNGWNLVGDGGGAGANHNLLSTTHSDTTAGTVARGDLITGQGATPAWARLAKGSASQCLQMDGTATDIIWGACAAGGGDNVLVNSTAATDANLNDSTPAAPAGTANIRWQKDTSAPNNLSAYLDTSTSYTFTANQNLKADNLTTTATDWLTLQNTTASTSGVPVQYSPALRLDGHAWDTGTSGDKGIAFRQYVVPISGNPAYGALNFQSSTNGGSTWTTRMSVDSSGSFGNITVLNVVNAGYWSSSGLISDVKLQSTKADIRTTPTDGLVSRNATAATSGVPVQYSPSVHWVGQAWDTAASQSQDWIAYLLPTSGSPTSNKLTFQSSIGGAAYAEQAALSSGGVFNVLTGFQVNGAAASGKILRGDGAKFTSADDVRSVTYIAGGDHAASDLDTTNDDEATVWRNNLGRTYRITEVWCESNSGSPQVNLYRDGTSGGNILSSDLTCSTSGATGTIASAQQDLAAGDKVDFLMQVASSGAKRVTVNIQLVAQ